MTSRKILYRVELSKHAEKDFSALDKAVQKRIFKALKELEESENHLALSLKLTGAKNIYRIRVGDYRIIYTPEKDGILVILVVLKIAHRSRVYG